MGYRHSREEILDAAVDVALDEGLARLTFRQVGSRLGIPDRTVVYYFPSKPDLVLAVAAALGEELQALLEQAFGSAPLDPSDLLRKAWPVLATERADRIFAAFFEVVGLAAAGQAPYDVLAPAMIEGWVAWLTPRTTGRTAAIRRSRALGVVAQIDGLLLVRRVLGAEAADAAYRSLRRPA